MLQTKLYRPPVTLEHVYRKQLIDKLNLNQYKALTLVSAPAGYGKSMLISSWLETCKCHYAWLSLSKEDSNLHNFLTGIISTVQKVFPNLMNGMRDLLDAPELPPSKALAESLINELDEIDEEFILVLDD